MSRLILAIYAAMVAAPLALASIYHADVPADLRDYDPDAILAEVAGPNEATDDLNQISDCPLCQIWIGTAILDSTDEPNPTDAVLWDTYTMVEKFEAEDLCRVWLALAFSEGDATAGSCQRVVFTHAREPNDHYWSPQP